MREIKAFIRASKVDEIVRALEEAGAPGVTLSRVHGVGYGYEPLLFTLSPSEIAKMPQVVKVEVVCADEDEERLVERISEVARTGAPGDGIVFITPVERVVRIRTGEDGRVALKK